MIGIRDRAKHNLIRTAVAGFFCPADPEHSTSK